MLVAHPQNQYFRPSVPFLQAIPGGLSDGMVVIINGTVTHSSDRFAVNFQCGHCSPPDDIAFHFNPRFHESVVVCNTNERQQWGSEERKHEMPFHKGHHFEIRILIKHHAYMVAVNGSHFLEYHHRVPLHRVNTLEINGSLDLANVAFQGTGYQAGFPPHGAFPPTQCPPGMYNPNVFPTPAVQPQTQHLHVPYHSPLYGGFYPTKTVVISGIVPHHAKRFHVNLKFPGGTAFHLNPRFEENTIVRNSFLNNSWGSEERGGAMPFSRGQSFTIVLTCEHHCIQVTVNGQHLFNYNHRVQNLHQIDNLEVEGDVELQYVQA